MANFIYCGQCDMVRDISNPELQCHMSGCTDEWSSFRKLNKKQLKRLLESALLTLQYERRGKETEEEYEERIEQQGKSTFGVFDESEEY